MPMASTLTGLAIDYNKMLRDERLLSPSLQMPLG